MTPYSVTGAVTSGAGASGEETRGAGTAAPGARPVEVRGPTASPTGMGCWRCCIAPSPSWRGRIDPPSSLDRLDPAGLAAKAGAERCFLAFQGDRLAGCLFCEPRADCLYLGKLAVEPELQGRGVGRALMARAEVEARALGPAALELQTRVELVENHAAFGAMGFVRTGESAHPGHVRPTSVTMRKALR